MHKLLHKALAAGFVIITYISIQPEAEAMKEGSCWFGFWQERESSGPARPSYHRFKNKFSQSFDYFASSYGMSVLRLL